MIQTKNLIGVINSIDIICDLQFKLYSFVKFLIYFFIVSNQLVVFSQTNKNKFNEVIIEADGEIVTSVYKITQDHHGYIWMTTNLGLIRYDGIEGKKYYNDSWPFNSIDALFVDSRGDIWVGNRSGLRKYNPDCDCYYHYPSVIDDITSNSVRAITEDKNNDIWFGIRDGGIFKYERESDSITRFLHKPSDSLTIGFDFMGQLLVDQFNNLWIGTNTGLLRYNIDTGQIKKFKHDPSDPSSLVSNGVTGLYEDQQGSIFIGTDKSGFHVYDPKSEILDRKVYDDKNPNQIHASYSEELVQGYEPSVNLMHQDQNGDYWISTTGKGLNHFVAKNKTFNNYTFNMVNPQIIMSIYEDRQGNLWVGGGMGSGLFKTDLFAPKYHLNTNLTHSEITFESSKYPGVLWVGIYAKGFRKFNMKTNKITDYVYNKDDINSIKHNRVRSIYQENKKTLWLGIGATSENYRLYDYGGLARMDIETEMFTHFKLTRNDDGRDDFSYTAFSLCEDNEGYLWLATGPGGIFRSDADKQEFEHFEIIKNDNSSKDVLFNIVRIDSNGDLWASDFTDDGTLYLYDRLENKFSPYLTGFKMYNLLVDDKGWLLISTWRNGLLHLNPKDKSFVQYNKKVGLQRLPGNDGLDIAKGEHGDYWIGTHTGPKKFDTKTGKISSIGLPKYTYNRGFVKASNGQIYMGTNTGLLSFFPGQAMENPYPPQINISELLISEENYLTNKNKSNELKLSYKQNDITINYVGLHFSNPEKNSYQYKLNPLDDKWINAGYERSVRFPKLSPGTYNFRVKAANGDGVWSDEVASVHFTINSPWWTTWWAYGIYFALFSFIAFKINRFQISKKLATAEGRRLKEVNEFKNNLYTNITHEFRTPLTVINGMTDNIKSYIKTKKFDDLENSLEVIERNSDDLLHLVNEMLDLAKIESGNMELQLIQIDVIPFLKYVSESFNSLAEENQINLNIYSEVDTLIMDFDEKKLSAVISNLLSNAIKFTNVNGKITVHINQKIENEKDYLIIKVKDNGIGIAEEALTSIFNRFYQADTSTIRKNEGTGIGLAITKEFVELMNGTIDVKSTPEKGSEFYVKIPVAKSAVKSEPNRNIESPLSTCSNSDSIRTIHTLDKDSKLPLLLIIEDNLDVAHYLRISLKNNYETLHAINGIIGIKMAIEKIPDIIISDVMMPGKDGFDVCKTLKKDERTDHIPIIMLTAKASIKDKLKGLSYGADAYLAKPFIKEELFARLEQLVSLRRKLNSKIQKEGASILLKKRTINPKLQFLQKIVKLIHKDIGDSNFGSEALSKILLVSESQIYRKIKAITGKSTAVYIRSVRLEFAKELLINTDKTIAEVAYDVGFNDPSWFSRVFKEEFGFSPRAARSK